MAKPKTPLLSLGATGTLAGVLTHRRHKGITVAEKKPTPADQKTPAQLITRSDFLGAASTWHYLPEAMRARYHAHNPQSGSFPAYVNWMKEFLMQKLELIIPDPSIEILSRNNITTQGPFDIDLTAWLPATTTLVFLILQARDTGSAAAYCWAGVYAAVDIRIIRAHGNHLNNEWNIQQVTVPTDTPPIVKWECRSSGPNTLDLRIRVIAYAVQT